MEGHSGRIAGVVVLGAAMAFAQPEKRVSDTEVFRLEDQYQLGNYLVMGGILAGATAQLTHDRELSLGFFAGSLLMRHAGMPIMGLSAEGLCRAHGVDSYCDNNALAIYALDLAAEAVLAYEVAAMTRDAYDGLPQDDTRFAIAWTAAGCAIASYVYAWYRFHEVRNRNVPEDARMTWAPFAPPGGGLGLALQLRFDSP